MMLEDLLEEALGKDGDVVTLAFRREAAERYRLTLTLNDGTAEGFGGVSVTDALDTMLESAGSDPEEEAEEDS